MEVKKQTWVIYQLAQTVYANILLTKIKTFINFIKYKCDTRERGGDKGIQTDRDREQVTI